MSITFVTFLFSYINNVSSSNCGKKKCCFMLYIPYCYAEMENITRRLCWELLKNEGDISIWRKPLNNSCYLSRPLAVQPSLCGVGDDPDNVWYFLLYSANFIM